MKSLLLVTALCVSIPYAWSQDPLLHFNGTLDRGETGYSVLTVPAAAGGPAGVLLATPDALLGNTPGNVFRLTAGGAVLWSFSGVANGDAAGSALALIGDLDGDGIREIVIGAPQKLSAAAATGPGYVTAVSGATGLPLGQLSGAASGDEFGSALSSVDLNGDGFLDLVVGVPGAAAGTGASLAYSGRTGALLRQWSGDQTGDRFGTAIAGLSDLDADGFGDVAIGAPGTAFGASRPGFVRAFSGRTGAAFYTLSGNAGGDLFGTSVSGGADLDGDSIQDLAVGATQFIDLCSPPGYVRVHSGADGSLIREHAGTITSSFFGFSTRLGEDASADGVGDLLIGVPQPFTDCAGGGGQAQLISGRTGNELYRFEGEEPDCDTGLFTEFGFATDLGGDLNGDGLADPLIGAIFAGSSCNFRPGSVDAFAGNDLFLNATPRQPRAGDPLVLRIAEGPAGHPTLLFLVGFNGVTLFVEVGGLQPFGQDETRTVAGTIPAGLAGSTLDFKAFARGAGGLVVDSAVESVTVR